MPAGVSTRKSHGFPINYTYKITVSGGATTRMPKGSSLKDAIAFAKYATTVGAMTATVTRERHVGGYTFEDQFFKKTYKRHSPRVAHAGRIIHQEPTGRPVFAEHQRDGHITTSGRRALSASQFALPPGPEEKRRGILGRLPINTLKRARNALTRATQMHKKRHISVSQLAEAKRRVHEAWPSIEIDA